MAFYEQQIRMIQPGNTDILCGRGKAYANHPGNRKFKGIIESNLPKYKNASRRIERSIVLAAVVDEVVDSGSRFLKKNKVTGEWTILDTDQCHEKVGHALRDLIRKIPKRSFETIKKQRQHLSNPEISNHAPYNNSRDILNSPLDLMPIWDTDTVNAIRKNEQRDQQKNNALNQNVDGTRTSTITSTMDSICDEHSIISIGNIQQKEQESNIHHKNNIAWDTSTNTASRTNQYNSQHANNYQQTKDELEKKLDITMTNLFNVFSNTKTPVDNQPHQPLDPKNNHPTRLRKRVMNPTNWDPIPTEIFVPDISPEIIQDHSNKHDHRLTEISLIRSILEDGKDSILPESTTFRDAHKLSFPRRNGHRNGFSAGGFFDDLVKEEPLSDFQF